MQGCHSACHDKLEFVGEMTGEGTGNILKDLLRCEEQGTGSAAAALSVETIGILGGSDYSCSLFPVPSPVSPTTPRFSRECEWSLCGRDRGPPEE